MLHVCSQSACLQKIIQSSWLAFVSRYILPSLSLVPADPEEAVRVQYALVLSQLAAAANRFLLHLQQLANTQLHPDPSSPTLVSPEA